ncbi:recombinase family protein [Rothia sp. P7208]|uniref:recombinase family protein n=1 Tax=Rothia sp. P7208 TaxID=3402660 RepID=UPI003AC2095D
MRPLGYAVNGDVIPEEAKAVRAIYRLFTRSDHPESLRSLARGLSGTELIPGLSPRPKHSHVVSVERAQQRIAEGKEPRTVQPDGEWSPSTVLGILRNPRYTQMSTYTPKLAQADGGRRRSWRAQILRDDAGEPIRGQWDAIVDDETWWRAQTILDDAERVTNTSGSTKRKHLGSGLYRCGICGAKVTGASRGYRCAQHVERNDDGTVIVPSLMRSGVQVDEFVTALVAERLKQPDALRKEASTDQDAVASGIAAAISEQRARILRAQRDYDEEIIEGRDLKRIRDAAEARIAQLETERLLSGQAAGLAPVLGVDDPSEVFLNASLAVQRQVIDVLVTVTLLPQPRGKKGFNPDSVGIEWR